MLDIPPPEPPQVVELTHQCISETADAFDLPTRLLYSVLTVEGGKVGQTVENTNGTYDMGPMQINSIWLDFFSGYVTREQIIYDGCINVHVGAWILRANINEAGGDFWRGVGNYHSKTPKFHYPYQQRIYAASLTASRE